MRPGTRVSGGSGRQDDRAAARPAGRRHAAGSQVEAARAVRRPDQRDQLCDRVLVGGERARAGSAGSPARAAPTRRRAQSWRLVMSQNSTAARRRTPASGQRQPRALDPGPAGRQRHHPVGHHVVGVGGDQQVGQQVQVLHGRASEPRAAAWPPARRSATSSPCPRAGPSTRRPSCRAGRSCRRSPAARPGTAPGGSTGSGSTRGSSRRSPSSSPRPRRCAGRRPPGRPRRTAPGSRPGRRRVRSNAGTSGLPSGCSACPNTHPCQTVTGSSTSPCSAVSKPVDVAEAGRALQRTAEVVGPRVVRAGDRPAARGPSLRQQLVAAVPAGVREHPEAAPCPGRPGSRCRRSPARAGWCARRGTGRRRRPRQVQLPA